MFPTLKVCAVLRPTPPDLEVLTCLLLNAKMFGVGSIPWSPLAQGMLARPLSAQSGTKRSSDQWYVRQPEHQLRLACFDICDMSRFTQWIDFQKESGMSEIVNRYAPSVRCPYYRLTPCTSSSVLSVEELSKKKGVSMAQVSIAWMLTKEGRCTLIAH